MGYDALEKMREINRSDYGVEGTVRIPDLPSAAMQKMVELIREFEGLTIYRM